jgi:prefoldin subunit 5
MSNPQSVTFLISKAVEEQLDRRVGLFQELKSMQSQAKTVADQAAENGQNASAETLGMLTSSQTPPEEIAQAAKYVQREIESIREIDANVATAENEITAINQLNKNLMIGIAAVVLILIFVVMSN